MIEHQIRFIFNSSGLNIAPIAKNDLGIIYF